MTLTQNPKLWLCTTIQHMYDVGRLEKICIMEAFLKLEQLLVKGLTCCSRMSPAT